MMGGGGEVAVKELIFIIGGESARALSLEHKFCIAVFVFSITLLRHLLGFRIQNSKSLYYDFSTFQKNQDNVH
jgi:hypothetical protein